jgi:ADP-heptose:LPS heptosyltransferase
MDKGKLVSFLKKTKTALRNFDKYRRNKMKRLEVVLYQLLNNKESNQSQLMEPKDIKRVAVVRNNSRIGNMYFLIPFLTQTRALYPNAKITLVLKQPWQGDVFKGLKVDNFSYTNFSFKSLFAYIKEIRQLKKTSFDLILVPANSVEDSMIAAMLDAKNKVSSSNELRNQCYTHTFVNPSTEVQHSALSNLFLLEAMGNELVYPISHELALDTEEVEFGCDEIAQIDHQSPIIAYFRGARGSKQLSDSHWRELLQKFEEASTEKIHWVEVLSPDITAPLEAGRDTIFQKDMRLLASLLQQMDAFICCDTGPLHLADAAGVNCIGLYNKTNPAVFGVLGKNSVNAVLEDFDPKHALETVLERN